jgi:hypothetical protein
VRALLAFWLAVLPVWAAADTPEQSWAAASAAFDGSSKAKMDAPVISKNKCFQAQNQLAAAASAEAAHPTVVAKPKGLGPASWALRPNYGEALLGGLLGLFLAPILFAYEALVATIAMPVRMIKGLAKGDLWYLLEPLRTVKNLIQDSAMLAVGVLNSATAPVWNAIKPENGTDFQFENDRLKFIGGPFELLLHSVKDCYGPWGAATTSWHTSFWSRESFVANGTDRSGAGHSLDEHETVHNVQWKHSFLWEKQSHDFVGKDYSAAKESINW